MVWFMGEYSHISAEFDNVVSVVLENYEDPKKETKEIDPKMQVSQEDLTKAKAHVLIMTRIPSWKHIVNDKGELNLTVDEAKNPHIWSRVCVHNMANLAKEANTIRRDLESLFRYFDNNNSWSPQRELAPCVLLDMQLLIEQSGQNTHLLLSILVKHLDHKVVIKHPEMQLNIVEVTTSLTEHSKSQTSATIIGAMNDLVRHLHKPLQNSVGNEGVINGPLDKFRKAVDDCLVQLSKKVGDAGPILDMMAVMSENISTTVEIARLTISVIYHTTHIIASVPNLSYQNKEFP